ncbi:MAG TPA: adenylate/guanylate cyclase domain-containing protein [Acidimicrobiia bacterium]|nr:adenylate/guanylate cyclase domain-containing protein [Acidimicrobiia bacterium]
MTTPSDAAGWESQHLRSFDAPDDVIRLDGVTSRIVTFQGIAIAHNTHEPGWRWSVAVKHVVKTDWCETHHVGYSISGSMAVLMADGRQMQIGPGDAYDIPTHHDAWVLGDEPWVCVDWVGVRSWIPPLDLLADRVLATLLFTDIVGSTEIASRIGDVRWGDMVASHEAGVRDVLDRFRGREVKQTGDGVLALFESPERAVRCAVALGEMASSLGLSIRAGVHTGEVEVTANDLRGIAVHETARIMAIAGGSEVLVSSATRGLLESPDFDFEDRGEHQLRGIETPRRIYAVSI